MTLCMATDVCGLDAHPEYASSPVAPGFRALADCGGRVDDPYDDFVGRYMFAFWRLIAQGVTAAGPLQAASGGRTADGDDGSVPREPDVRVIRLAAPSPRPSDPVGETKRLYHHRWPVRMHKVRQWYPSHQEHRVIWRGPYIKGPADASLMMGEKAYLVDS